MTRTKMKELKGIITEKNNKLDLNRLGIKDDIEQQLVLVWKKRFIPAESRLLGCLERRKEEKNVSTSGYEDNPKINKYSKTSRTVGSDLKHIQDNVLFFINLNGFWELIKICDHIWKSNHKGPLHNFCDSKFTVGKQM